MTTLNYDVLRTSKAALDEGLIDENDYDAVKRSFLKAQQIKAGLDAGFIPEAEYTHVKRAFLESLNIGLSSSDGHISINDAPGPAGTLAAPHKAPEVHAKPHTSQATAPRSAIGNPDHSAGAGKSSASAAPERKAEAPRLAAPAPAVRKAAAPAPAAAQNDSAAVRLGRTEVPFNIPNLGGRRPKQAQATSMSGIAVSDDAVNMYYFLKAKSTVIIADVGDKDSTYDDFLSVLPPSDCRYGVYDYPFTNSEGCIFNKIVFFSWAPDVAKIKAKMMYASTKDFFKGFLDGLSVEMQASDVADISEKDVSEAVRSSTTRQ